VKDYLSSEQVLALLSLGVKFSQEFITSLMQFEFESSKVVFDCFVGFIERLHHMIMVICIEETMCKIAVVKFTVMGEKIR
jgi:hypothetical protein